MKVVHKLVIGTALTSGALTTGMLFRTSGQGTKLPDRRETLFEVRYESRAAADTRRLLAASAQRGEAGGAADLTTKIQARWRLTPVRASADGVWAAVRMEGVELDLASGGAPLAEPARGFERELRKPFFVKLAPNGAVSTVQFGAEWPGDARSIARTLIGLGQVVRPLGGAGRDRWTVTEEGTGARFLTEYRRIGEKGGLPVLERRRLSATAGEGRTVVAVPADLRGGMRCVVEPDGGVVSIDGGYDQTSRVGSSPIGRESVEFHLRRLGQSNAAPPDVAELGRLLDRYAAEEPSRPLSEIYLAPDQERRFALQALGGKTEAALLNEVQLLRRGATGGGNDLAKLCSQLAALFRVAPASCAAFARTVDGESAASPALGTVAAALGAAGHPAAQAALVQMLNGTSDFAGRARLIVPALAQVPRPSAATEAAIRNLSTSSQPDLRGTGYLGLGIVAGQLRASDAARAQGIERELAGALSAASEPNEVGNLILAIGNVGSARSLEVAKRYLSDPRELYRQCAVAALGKVRSEEAVDLLLTRIAEDASYPVRMQAAAQLRFHELAPTQESRFLAVLKGITDSPLRTAMRRSVQGRPLSPALTVALESMESAGPPAGR